MTINKLLFKCNQSKAKFIDLLILAIILLTTIFFLQHYADLEVPNNDTFRFIGDGNFYKHFELPDLIHSQPLTPILIVLLTPFFSTEFPELRAAVFICSLSAALTLFLSFFIYGKKLANQCCWLFF